MSTESTAVVAPESTNLPPAYGILSPSREAFARLIAAERLAVVYADVPTAYFDLLARRIVMPFWSGLTDDQEILLVTHEVSHGLDTPPREFKGAIEAYPENERDIFHGYLNICEDARIERRIKGRYPGLKASYVSGYKKFLQTDLFGLKEHPVDTLPLIDRLNLSAKVGGLLKIPMTSDEMLWYVRLQRTNTFEEVVQLAKDLYEFDKKNANTTYVPKTDRNQLHLDLEEVDADDPRLKNAIPVEIQIEGEEGQGDGSGSGSGQGSGKQALGKITPIKVRIKRKAKAAADGKDGKKMDDTGNGQTASRSSGVGDGSVRLPGVPSTDASPMKYLSNLRVSGTAFERTEFPVYDPAATIISTRRLIEVGKKCQFTLCHEAEEQYRAFKASTRPVVAAMVGAFERQKSARAAIRAMQAKTGRLDPRRMATHKINEDIFKRLTILPKGKNHGFVVLLDWSGSMQHSMPAVIEQTYFIASFFRGIRVPFEVYAFTDSGTGTLRATMKRTTKVKNAPRAFGSSDETNFYLLQLLSSTANAQDFDTMFGWLYAVYRDIRASGTYTLHGLQAADWSGFEMFGQSGTPMLEGLVAVRNQLLALRKAHDLDKLHFVMMTDGGNGSHLRTPSMAHARSTFHTTIVDTTTGFQMPWSSNHGQGTMIPMLLDWIRITSGATVTWFYLSPRSPRKTTTEMESYLATPAPRAVKQDHGYVMYHRWGGSDWVGILNISLFGLASGDTMNRDKQKVLMTFVKAVS